nr:hypothetical protein [uncultured Paludibaculum sp.]
MRLTARMLLRCVLIFGLACPLCAQERKWEDVLAEARVSSGVWESITGAGEIGLFRGDFTVALNIVLHTTLERRPDGSLHRSQHTYIQAESTIYADAPRYCGEKAYDVETRTVKVDDCIGMKLQVTLAEDGERMLGEVQLNERKVPVEFRRVSTSRSEADPFQGTWTVTDKELDRRVTFHVSALKSGKIALTRDRFDHPEQPEFVSLAEPWQGQIVGNRLTGMAMRSAFNNTDFSAEVTEDGELLRISRCGGSMGAVCPAELARER